MNPLLDCWNFINVDVNGRGLVIKSSIETIEIHMVSDSHALSESQRNTGSESLISELEKESSTR